MVEELKGYLEKMLEIEEKRYASEFGRYIDAYRYNVMLKPFERKLIFEARGMGKLIETMASITMPDDTKPEVQFEVLFDDNLVFDWTCEEYYSLLGLKSIAGYGGYMIYDPVGKMYSWWTHWGHFGDFNSLLRVWLSNLTNVTVSVNVWDVQLRVIGEYRIVD